MDENSEFDEESEPPITLSKWVLLSWIPVILGVMQVFADRLHYYVSVDLSIFLDCPAGYGLLFIALPAILLGHLALIRTRTAWPPKSGAGLAFTGLVLGYFFGVLYLAEWLVI